MSPNSLLTIFRSVLFTVNLNCIIESYIQNTKIYIFCVEKIGIDWIFNQNAIQKPINWKMILDISFDGNLYKLWYTEIA